MIVILTEKKEISLKEIQSYYGVMSLNGSAVKVASPKDITCRTKNVSIISKSYNPVTKMIENTIKEKCFARIWRDATYVMRSR